MDRTLATANIAQPAGIVAWRTAIIVVAAVATRLVTFGNPILYTDEEFYFAVGRAMTNGALPFVDIWDRKPIGLFLLYAAPAALPGGWGIWMYQALALAFAIATAIVIARLADAAGWTRGGTLAGVAYLAWITIGGGQGGQSPVFYNLAMACAALLIVDQKRFANWRGALAMLLVGLAIQIKYTAALEGVYFGLCLMVLDHRGGRRPLAVAGRGAVLAIIALLPTIAVTGVYVSKGQLPAFMFANFESIFSRNADPMSEQLGNLAKAAAILLPLLAMAAGSCRSTGKSSRGPRIFIVGWLLAALVAFALLPPWSDHYTLPVMVPAAIAAAAFFSRKRGRMIGITFIGIAAMVGQASLVIDRERRGTPAQFAALAKAVGRGPGCLYVYSSSSMLYPATGRCAVSRYVFPSHLTRKRENGAIGVNQMDEMKRIFTAGPAIVVMGPPYEGERNDVRTTALTLLNKDYRLASEMPLGRKRVAVYERRSAAPVERAISRFD